MSSPKKKAIPNLQTNQLDDYLFGSWKPTVSGIFDSFHIVRIKDYRHRVSFPVSPHRRTAYFFFFLTAGSAKRSKNLSEYDLRANDFYCLPANQITAMEYMSADSRGFYCHFHPEIFNQQQLRVDIERDFPFFDITAEPVVKIGEAQHFIRLLELLHEEYLRNETLRANIISLHLVTLLNEVKLASDVRHNVVSNAAFRLTQRYKNLLSEGVEHLRRVIDCAKLLEVSPNHLNKCVKETTGKSAHELLVEMRVLQAKVMLKQTDYPIKEIAFRVGGFESSDFTKFFKKSAGVSPSTYRSQQT